MDIGARAYQNGLQIKRMGMDSGPICHRIYRKVAILVCAGGSLFVANGCDATVRATVLDGFNALTNTLVDAFFQNVAANQTDGTVTTGT